MERESVTSSNIRNAGYDSESKTLEIEFISGVYKYRDVPVEVWNGLKGAPSKGRYFAQNIKGKFPCERG